MRNQSLSQSSAGHAPPTAKIHIIQGEQHVTSDPDVMVTTLLGSCVAACMRDPVAGVGGMNHFLLPGNELYRGASMSHGVHAMELLVNALLRHGARRERLEAKLFGGGRLHRGLTEVGEMNAEFAIDFLLRENIRSVGGSLRGDLGRRIQYWPVTGRARQTLLRPLDRTVFDKELQLAPQSSAPDTGSLELF